MDRESYGVTMLSRRWSIRGKSSAEHLASLSALDSSGAGSVIAPVAKAYKQGRNYPLLCTPQLSECPYNIRVYIYISPGRPSLGQLSCKLQIKEGPIILFKLQSGARSDERSYD